MLTINAMITQPFNGAVVASIGDENSYVTLTMHRLSSAIELVTGLPIYQGLTGHYEYEELGREIADDEDEAIEAATDLEWAAQAKLKVLDVTDFWKEPGGFPETLERVFQTSTSHASAAE
jgi:hypothetical protein